MSSRIDDEVTDEVDGGALWETVKNIASVLVLVWLLERWLFPGMLDFLPWYGNQASSVSDASLNDAVRDGDLTFVITQFDCGKKAIGGGLLGVKAQGEFCVAQMTVTNTGDEPATLNSGNQMLFIEDAEYEATTVLSGDDSIFLEHINPGNTRSGFVAWDIPRGGSPDRLELHDSAFSAGASVDVEVDWREHLVGS